MKSTDYNFSPIVFTRALAPGINTITLPNVPLGVNGTDGQHFLRVIDLDGSDEIVEIEGGSAVGGANGTLIFTCKISHLPGWTLQSASSGIKEASIAQNGQGVIDLPSGRIPLNGTLVLPTTISLKGQGCSSDGLIGTVLECKSPVGMIIADGLGEATNQGLSEHQGYTLIPATKGQGIGLMIGGDGVIAPTSWWGSYVRLRNVAALDFAISLVHRAGNFVEYSGGGFAGTLAILVPSDGRGGQPINFFNVTLSVPSGPVIQCDQSNYQSSPLIFFGGQISGTIVGSDVAVQAFGTHFEPNNPGDVIADLTNGILGIHGGLLSVHGSPPAMFTVNGSHPVDLSIDNHPVILADGSFHGSLVKWRSTARGSLCVDLVDNLSPLTTLADVPSSGNSFPNLSIRCAAYNQLVYINSANVLTLPEGNYPSRGIVYVNGPTVPGGISSIHGLIQAQIMTLVTKNPQTFYLGNTLSTIPGLAYTVYSDGTNAWIR